MAVSANISFPPPIQMGTHEEVLAAGDTSELFSGRQEQQPPAVSDQAAQYDITPMASGSFPANLLADQSH